MRQLVIGLGEVGTAIQSILQCDGYDAKDSDSPRPQLYFQYDVLHICIPFSDITPTKMGFVEIVRRYKDRFKATLVIVHSTVLVGTCDKENWVHSPVRGVHPNLEQGIRTFVKYFGGDRAHEAAEIFRAHGIICTAVNKASSTEALKLWDTTQYGLMILIQKEIHRWCEENNVPFDLIYTDANHTYSIGYETLNRPEVARPYLKHMPGPIGGHCVIPNAHLLSSLLTELLIDFNTKLTLDQKPEEAL